MIIYGCNKTGENLGLKLLLGRTKTNSLLLQIIILSHCSVVILVGMHLVVQS